MAEREVQLKLTETGFEEIAEKLDEIDEKLDSIIEKLDQIGKKIESPELRLEGGDEVDEELDGIDEKLDEIGEKIETPKLDVEGVEDATAELEEFDEKLDSTDEKAEAAEASLGGLSTSLNDVSGSTEGASEAQSDLNNRLERVGGSVEALSAWLDELDEALDSDSASALTVSDAFSRVRMAGNGVRNMLDDLDASLAGTATAMGVADVNAAALSEDEELLAQTTAALRDRQAELAAATDVSSVADAEASVTTAMRATNIELLDKAMDSAVSKSAQLAAAQTLLGIPLAVNDKLAGSVRDKLEELGFSELQAAAGSAALTAALTAQDAILTGAGGGGGFLKTLFSDSSGFGNLFEGGGGLTPPGLGSIITPLLAAVTLAPLILGIIGEIGSFITSMGVLVLSVGSFVALAIPGFEAVKDAIGDTRKELEKLPADERNTVLGIRELEASYKSMAKAFEPDVFKVLNAGVRVANQLLPELKPLADAAAGAITHVLNSIDRAIELVSGHTSTFDKFGHLFSVTTPGAGSGGFQEFIKWASGKTPVIIDTLATDLGRLAGAWAKAAEGFSNKDFINSINVAFNILIGSLNLLTRGVHEAMSWWDALSAGVKQGEQWFYAAGHGISEAMKLIGSTVKTDAQLIVSETIADWKLLVSSTAQDWHDVAHGVSDGIDAARETVVAGGHAIEHAWDVSVTWVENFSSQLPIKVVNALRSLPGDMLHMGEMAVDGLLHGLEAAAGGVLSWVEGLGHDISGIFATAIHAMSPSRVFYEHGQNIIRGLVMGLEDGLPLVDSVMRRLTTASMPGGTHGFGNLATAGASGNAPLQVEWIGGGGADAEFIAWLKKQIRIRGGNPAVLGR